jgi:hypothetical protein
MCEYVGQACFIEVHGFKGDVLNWVSSTLKFEPAIKKQDHPMMNYFF